MKKLNELLFRFFALFRRERLEADMREEMHHHLEMSAREFTEHGMSPDKAHEAARRKFGHMGSIQEASREERGFVWLENAAKDLRHGVRVLLRAPLSR
jgi:hypothetical protein